MGEDRELEFFGVTIKCKSAHLAALLNSSVTEDVIVVGQRARDLLTGGDSFADDFETDAVVKSEAEERDEILSMICEAD